MAIPKLEHRLPGALWRGCACGVLAGAPIVLIELALLARGVDLPSSRDLALVGLTLATLTLWPAALIGAVGAALGWALRRGPGAFISAGWLKGRALLLAGVGIVTVAAAAANMPGLEDTTEARQIGFAGAWLVLWVVLMWLGRPDRQNPRRRSDTRTDAPPALSWWLGRAAMALILLLIWGGQFVLLRWDEAPRLRALVLNHVPLTGLVGRHLQSLFDLDGDGHSAYFGGGDCAGDNPAVHPSAREIAGNGVDEDCDGQDLPIGVVLDDARASVQRAAAAAQSSAARLDAQRAGRALSRPPLARLPVVLITVDTLRPDILGAWGASPSPSPHLDALARRGVVFERAWAQAPLTKASVSSMMTGRYFCELPRSRARFTRIFDKNIMLAEVMGEQGYATEAVTSHPYLSERYGFDQGFDGFECVSQRRERWNSDRAVDAALARLERLDSPDAAPWFLWLHLIDPHHPYEPHEESAALARSLSLTPDDSAMGRYLLEVAWVDAQLGRLFDAMERRGTFERAMVVVHSDHGESFGEHGLKHHGQAPFEEQIRAVLVVSAPGVAPGRRQEPVMLMDLAPTLTAMALQTPLEAHPALGDPALGRPISLWPTLLGEPLPKRPIFAERPGERGRVRRLAVLDDPWKLTHAPDLDTWTLHDLSADPGELRDRMDDEPEQAARLQRLLRRFASSLDEVEAR